MVLHLAFELNNQSIYFAKYSIKSTIAGPTLHISFPRTTLRTSLRLLRCQAHTFPVAYSTRCQINGRIIFCYSSLAFISITFCSTSLSG